MWKDAGEYEINQNRHMLSVFDLQLLYLYLTVLKSNAVNFLYRLIYQNFDILCNYTIYTLLNRLYGGNSFLHTCTAVSDIIAKWK